MDKKYATIKVGGVDYKISGYEPEEYMQRVAIYTDKKMTEVKKTCFSLDSTLLAILTAINIADDFLKTSDAYDEITKQNGELMKELERLNKLIDEKSRPTPINSNPLRTRRKN